MSRQSLKARKALRSASALKGWETRRLSAVRTRLERQKSPLSSLDPGALDGWLMPAARVTDPSPWPPIAAAIRRGWQQVCGWFR